MQSEVIIDMTIPMTSLSFTVALRGVATNSTFGVPCTDRQHPLPLPSPESRYSQVIIDIGGRVALLSFQTCVSMEMALDGT